MDFAVRNPAARRFQELRTCAAPGLEVEVDMGTLRSDLFKDDPKLEACAASPAGHIAPAKRGQTPPRGSHVGKIHQALAILEPGAAISETEKIGMEYGETTANAVLAYKRRKKIINTSYQHEADNIVGQMTVAKMDEELFGKPAPRTDVVDRAFNDSRSALRNALLRLRTLQNEINSAMAADETPRLQALIQIQISHNRDIEVVARRLLISHDVSSKQFRDALAKAIQLLERNLAQPKSLLAAGKTGLCDPTHPRNAAGLPHAWTVATQADPKTHLCEPFFTGDSRDLQRDVVTHEIFHVIGLGDNSVTNTAQAFTNANTLAQIVAFINDRFRQANSDGGERASPPLPTP